MRIESGARRHRVANLLALAIGLLVTTAAQAVAQDIANVPVMPLTEPGLLELRANPITIENPLPALILGSAPIYPGEAVGTGAAGTMVFRITIDSFGAVAEARYLGHERWALREVRGHLEAAPMLDSIFLAASENALRGWLYEPPVAAPISLDVEFAFSGSGRSRTVWQEPAEPIPPRATASATGPTLGETHVDALRIAGMAPKRIKNVSPTYPSTALGQHLDGMVLIEILIDTTGHVADTRVVRSDPAFNDAAIAAVRQWEFEPTVSKGALAPVIMTVVVEVAPPAR